MAKLTEAEAELALRAAKHDAKRAELETLGVEDAVGVEWHARAAEKWAGAEGLADMVGGSAIQHYDPEPLPDFGAGAPAHVTREVLGRFLVDRDTAVVHDVHRATPACAIDGIRNGTFYHFWVELLDNAIDEVPCSECLG